MPRAGNAGHSSKPDQILPHELIGAPSQPLEMLCGALIAWRRVLKKRKPAPQDAISKPQKRDLTPISSTQIHWDGLPSVQLEAGSDHPLEFAALSNATKKRGSS